MCKQCVSGTFFSSPAQEPRNKAMPSYEDKCQTLTIHSLCCLLLSNSQIFSAILKNTCYTVSVHIMQQSMVVPFTYTCNSPKANTFHRVPCEKLNTHIKQHNDSKCIHIYMCVLVAESSMAYSEINPLLSTLVQCCLQLSEKILSLGSIVSLDDPGMPQHLLATSSTE